MSATIDIDRFCPTRSDDPYWNESAWFSFSVPERAIHGMVYYFFRPNMNLLMGGPILWDPTGSCTWDCLYHDWHQLQAIPPGAEKFDIAAPNSLDVRTLEPENKYRLRYDTNGFKMDLRWTATAEPRHWLGMEIEATGQTADSRMHFEQMGRVTGKVELNGEMLEVDCFSMRDSSWGVRKLDTVKRGSYFWAVASERENFFAQCMGDNPDQRVVGGFLTRDGTTSALVRGNRVNTKMGKLTPDSFKVEITDALGRTAEITAYTRCHLLFAGYPRCQVVWSLLEADFGNGVKGWGDLQEFQPMEGFRRMVRTK